MTHKKGWETGSLVKRKRDSFRCLSGRVGILFLFAICVVV